jgi:hypothetical protein
MKNQMISRRRTNIRYGLCNKSKNVKQYSNVFLSEEEAKQDGGFIKKLGPGFINVKQNKKFFIRKVHACWKNHFR